MTFVTSSSLDSFSFNGRVLRVALPSDVPDIRRLVNAAYRELADQGLNYTATFQDEELTRERIQKGRAFVLHSKGKLIATILLTKENFFTQRNSSYVGQFAVLPELKGQGLGSLLMDFCEDLSFREGFESMQLDTAKPALHLVAWYQRRGYQIVGEKKWEGKTYESWIFEKILRQDQNAAPGTWSSQEGLRDVHS